MLNTNLLREGVIENHDSVLSISSLEPSLKPLAFQHLWNYLFSIYLTSQTNDALLALRSEISYGWSAGYRSPHNTLASHGFRSFLIFRAITVFISPK